MASQLEMSPVSGGRCWYMAPIVQKLELRITSRALATTSAQQKIVNFPNVLVFPEETAPKSMHSRCHLQPRVLSTAKTWSIFHVPQP